MPTDRERFYYVYILGSISGTLYIGVTGTLRRRIWQHKQHLLDGFTAEHDITRLLYFERYQYIGRAIAREKQLKGWRREKKVALIEKNKLGGPEPRMVCRSYFACRATGIVPRVGVLRLRALRSLRSG